MIVTTSLLLVFAVGCLGFDPPKIIKPDRKVTKYISKDSFAMQCNAKGTQPITYKWKRQTAPFVYKDVDPNKIKVNAETGEFVIDKFREEHNGKYICVASNTLRVPGDDDITATQYSPIVELIKAQFKPAGFYETPTKTVTQYDYLKIPCEIDIDVNVNSELLTRYLKVENYTFNFFKNGDRIQDFENGRIFLDKEATLHFAYLTLEDDTQGQEGYQCGMDIPGNTIKYRKLILKVNSADAKARSPILQYSHAVPVDLYGDANLECMFSGYDPTVNNYGGPRVLWKDKNGNSLLPDSTQKRYEISEDSHTLTLFKVQESDEGTYTCEAQDSNLNTTAPAQIELDIISPPIWVPNEKEGAPSYLTVPEGRDAVFNCNARSLKGEQEPGEPVWLINGVTTRTHTQSNKSVISEDKKKLTVLNVTSKDILCVQCRVSNSYGTLRGVGCLSTINVTTEGATSGVTEVPISGLTEGAKSSLLAGATSGPAESPRAGPTEDGQNGVTSERKNGGNSSSNVAASMVTSFILLLVALSFIA